MESPNYTKQYTRSVGAQLIYAQPSATFPGMPSFESSLFISPSMDGRVITTTTVGENLVLLLPFVNPIFVLRIDGDYE